MINNVIKSKIKEISLIISDVDGILTDGSIFIGADGTEFKQFSVEDGAGVAFARYSGLNIGFISGRFSNATKVRMDELKIKHCFQGKLNKLESYNELCNIYNVTNKQVAYIGDGIIDLPVIECSAVSFAPPNSHHLVIETVDIITKKNGGRGVFREVVETILQVKGIYNDVLKKMREEVYKG
tara:strand:- start:32 stop:577 length:546 start_codon:yes stop_codon:yes gene_type:complete